MEGRKKVCTYRHQFADGNAVLIESPILKSHIVKTLMSSLLPYDEGFEVLSSLFPQYPLEGFISCCFELIMRYTYVQHNYLLFAFRIPELFDCSDIEIVSKIGRNVVAIINKYTYDVYVTKFRFSEEVYKGTLLDGILVKDKCVYPDYFESEYTIINKFSERNISEENRKLFQEYLAKHNQNKLNGVGYDVDNNSNNSSSAINQEQELCDDNNDLQEISKKVVSKEPVVNLLEIKNNFANVTQKIDYTSIYRQRPLPAKHYFYIQSVYQLCGEKIMYNKEKLVDAISYKTLLKLQSVLFNGVNWIKDSWIEPFELKNCVDTMYYTRHTQVDLRNPFHNDYLRYHPQYNTPSEFEHFLPKMTEDGKLWKDVYTLSDDMFECVLTKTEYPYVYNLARKNKSDEEKYAKIMTLEGRRYIRVILNKIHSDKTKPLRIMCKSVVRTIDNCVVGWTPVKYG